MAFLNKIKWKAISALQIKELKQKKKILDICIFLYISYVTERNEKL